MLPTASIHTLDRYSDVNFMGSFLPAPHRYAVKNEESKKKQLQAVKDVCANLNPNFDLRLSESWCVQGHRPCKAAVCTLNNLFATVFQLNVLTRQLHCLNIVTINQGIVTATNCLLSAFSGCSRLDSTAVLAAWVNVPFLQCLTSDPDDNR